MRWGFIVALASCYSPSSPTPCAITCIDSCPGNLQCVAGVCEAPGGGCGAPGDGMPSDGMVVDGEVDVDGPPVTPLCVAPTMLQLDEPLTFGEAMRPRIPSESYALVSEIFFDSGSGTNRRRIAGTKATNFIANYVTFYEDTADIEYGTPSLAPDGRELFMRFRTVVSDSTVIVRSVRPANVNGWGAIPAINLPSSFDPTGYDPSAPTVVTPRRMLLSQQNSLVELEETDGNAPTTWDIVRNESPAFVDPGNSTVNFLGHAHLTEEGRRLVFRGQVGGGIIRAYYVDRESLGVPFGSPARQLPNDPNLSVRHPVLTSDCKFLFYGGSDSNTHRVTY